MQLLCVKVYKRKFSNKGTSPVPRRTGAHALPVIAGAISHLKHPEAKAAEGSGTVTLLGKQLEQLTMLTEVRDHIRQLLSLGSSLASSSQALGFFSRIKSYSQHMKNGANFTKEGGKPQNLKLQPHLGLFSSLISSI